jgi:hypothetical protein
MPAPGRYPNGVNNAAKNSTMWNYGSMDPTRFHIYWNDFDSYAAGDWTITETGSGTKALADADGGVLGILTGASSGDLESYNKVGESFLLASGKKAWFKSRLKVSEATLTDVVMGLQVTDTTPLDVTDGIYFLKATAGTSWSFIVRKDATTGSLATASVATCVADTYMTLGWYYDGKASLEYYINDVKSGTVDPTNYFPDVELTIGFGVKNGEAVAKTLSIDYILAAQER